MKILYLDKKLSKIENIMQKKKDNRSIIHVVPCRSIIDTIPYEHFLDTIEKAITTPSYKPLEYNFTHSPVNRVPKGYNFTHSPVNRVPKGYNFTHSPVNRVSISIVEENFSSY